MEDFHYIPGKINPADIATREDGMLEDIGIESEWQSPTFLRKPREDWPLVRDFRKRDPPQEELRKNFSSFLAVKINPERAKLWGIVERICNMSNSWKKCLRILARVLRSFNLINHD